MVATFEACRACRPSLGIGSAGFGRSRVATSSHLCSYSGERCLPCAGIRLGRARARVVWAALSSRSLEIGVVLSVARYCSMSHPPGTGFGAPTAAGVDTTAIIVQNVSELASSPCAQPRIANMPLPPWAHRTGVDPAVWAGVMEQLRGTVRQYRSGAAAKAAAVLGVLMLLLGVILLFSSVGEMDGDTGDPAALAGLLVGGALCLVSGCGRAKCRVVSSPGRSPACRCSMLRT